MVPEILRAWLWLLKETLNSCKSFSDVMWGGASLSLSQASSFSPILGCVELSLPCASPAHFPKKT